MRGSLTEIQRILRAAAAAAAAAAVATVVVAVVVMPSTDRALCCLTAEVERDPVHSARYGRRRNKHTLI